MSRTPKREIEALREAARLAVVALSNPELSQAWYEEISPLIEEAQPWLRETRPYGMEISTLLGFLMDLVDHHGERNVGEKDSERSGKCPCKAPLDKAYREAVKNYRLGRCYPCPALFER